MEAPPGNDIYLDFIAEAVGEDYEQYIMAPHSIYADIYAEPNIHEENPILLMCDGVGSMPQAVYKD